MLTEEQLIGKITIHKFINTIVRFIVLWFWFFCNVNSFTLLLPSGEKNSFA